MTRNSYAAVGAYVYPHIGADKPIAHCANAEVAESIAALLRHAADTNTLVGSASAREEARHARLRK